jgi:hypothetical protein
MKPGCEGVKFARPGINDPYGPISGFDELKTDVSRGMKERALLASRAAGYRTTGAWLRDVVARELMKETVARPAPSFRTENGVTAIVHDVKRRGE